MGYIVEGESEKRTCPLVQISGALCQYPKELECGHFQEKGVDICRYRIRALAERETINYVLIALAQH